MAHRLFDERGFGAVTMADIARAADVATQTIFNNFPSKEALFFDGRAPWVDGPAAAVRERAAGVAPLDALHAHLLDAVHSYALSRSSEDRARFIALVEAAPSLQAHERALTFEAEVRLREALDEAWAAAGDLPAHGTAAVVAATWLAITRSLLAVERRIADTGLDPQAMADGITAVTLQVLEVVRLGLETHLAPAESAGTPATIRGGAGVPTLDEDRPLTSVGEDAGE
ncbi:TetR/AcrR family transcriptional regulator [Geodermatophilus nigrescens]